VAEAPADVRSPILPRVRRSPRNGCCMVALRTARGRLDDPLRAWALFVLQAASMLAEKIGWFEGRPLEPVLRHARGRNQLHAFDEHGCGVGALVECRPEPRRWPVLARRDPRMRHDRSSTFSSTDPGHALRSSRCCSVKLVSARAMAPLWYTPTSYYGARVSQG